MNFSKIYITKDFDSLKENLLQKVSGNIVKIFEKDDFLLEDAKAVTKEAYIKEERIKYIFIIAKSYNLYAQNSLLKLLEEAPKDTIFILLSNSKSNFLPTIRSRLPIEVINDNKRERSVELNLSKMSLGDIFEFIKNHQRVSKNELKELLQDIFYEAIHKYHMEFTKEEMENFENALKLADLNSRAPILLSLVLTTIIDRKKR